MKKIREEKGSITLFVLVAMLFFMLFLVGMYMLSARRETGTLSETARIKEIYEKDMNQIDDVYATLDENEQYTKYTVTYKINNVEQLEEVYMHDVTVYLTNNTSQDIESWKIRARNTNVSSIECETAQYSLTEEEISFSNKEDNGLISAKNEISFDTKIYSLDDKIEPTLDKINTDDITVVEKEEATDKTDGEEILQVEVSQANSWTGSDKVFQTFDIKLKNTQDIEIVEWTFDIIFKDNTQIQSIWNASYSNVGNTYTFQNVSYNASILSNSEITVGFIIASDKEQDIEVVNIRVKLKGNNSMITSNEGGLQLSIEETSSWTENIGTSQMFEIKLKNVQEAEIKGWKFDIVFDPSIKLQSAWNTEYENIDNVYTFKNMSYNGSILSNGEITLGFIITSESRQEELEAINIQVEK